MRSRKIADRSDFIKPVIVWEVNDSFLESQKTVDFPHNLPFVPLVIGEYSWNADFSDSRDFSAWLTGEENFYIGALANSIRVAMRRAEVSDRRIYVRAVGIAPPDYDGDIKPLRRKIKYDSKRRMLKIISFGAFRRGDVIRHNLGYAPMIYLWANTEIFRPGESRFDRMETCLRPGTYGVEIDDKEIRINNDQDGYYILTAEPIDEGV